MGRLVSLAGLACTSIGLFLLVSCSSSSSTNVITTNAVPTSVSLTTTVAVGTNVSLESGQTLALSAIAHGAQSTVLTEVFSYLSSNPTVVTVAENGFMCAGTWDSLTLPQVCSPGTVGTSQVSATAQGVSSPPITVYVHQRITSITVSKAPVQPKTTLSTACLSKGAPSGPESWLYQATALNGSTDITASVGPFSWQQINPGSTSIVNLTSLPIGSPLNQEIVTAQLPGQAPIFAAASGFNGQPSLVETCPIEKISVAVANNAANTLQVNTGTSTTLNATVTDSLNQTLTSVPLTWSTSNATVATVSANNTSTVYGSVGTVSASVVGDAVITASCTPPTCNAGFTPSFPIYGAPPSGPETAISLEVRSNTAPTSPTAYATTTACSTANPTNATCTPLIFPLTKSSTTNLFSAGVPVSLPSSPNSFLFGTGAASGNSAVLGVDSRQFGQNKAMLFTGTAASSVNGTYGKVLAISNESPPTVMFSDTVDNPNVVLICSSCSGTTGTITTLQITGATAAAFSPDNLKAYIVAGTNLYVYSKVDALQTIPLSAAANDVAFLGQGGFSYLAGGASSSITMRRTCDNAAISGAALATSSTPSMIRVLPDAKTVLALDPPAVDLISVSGLTSVGCSGTVSDTIRSIDLGQGAFVPTQLIVSSDASTAYILGNTPPPNSAPLPFVMVFNIVNQTTVAMSLANNAVPLSAGLSPAGDLLFVGGDDSAVHVIDTSLLQDTQQITLSFSTEALCAGPGTPATPVPKTVVGIAGVSQNGPNWDYSYAVNSGPQLTVGETIVVTGMTDGGNNGTFTILAVGGGKFTVANTSAVATTSTQNGDGTVPITCNPDLVAVAP